MTPSNTTTFPRAHRMQLPAMRADTFRAIVRASAIYDLIVTAPFMTPWSLMLAIGMIDYLHTSLGLPGALPTFGATHLLFAGHGLGCRGLVSRKDPSGRTHSGTL